MLLCCIRCLLERLVHSACVQSHITFRPDDVAGPDACVQRAHAVQKWSNSTTFILFVLHEITQLVKMLVPNAHAGHLYSSTVSQPMVVPWSVRQTHVTSPVLTVVIP